MLPQSQHKEKYQDEPFRRNDACPFSLWRLRACWRRNPVVAEQKAAYTNNKNNLIKAAEKMPEEAYSFKPTPEMEAFGAAHGSHRQPDRDVQRD